MLNQRNALCIARTDNQKHITNQRTDELTRHFSFQPDSEESDEHAPRASSARRAIFDKRLLEEIYERIALQSDLETRDLQLHARNGVVSIEGSVADRAMRARISNFIRRCSFAKSVINRMQTRDTNPVEEMQVGNERENRLAHVLQRGFAAA